jgi:hypothetical protein
VGTYITWVGEIKVRGEGIALGEGVAARLPLAGTEPQAPMKREALRIVPTDILGDNTGLPGVMGERQQKLCVS